MLILLFCSSQLVGLPTVTKDKISAYNFLDVESLTKTPAELSEFASQTFQNLFFSHIKPTVCVMDMILRFANENVMFDQVCQLK